MQPTDTFTCRTCGAANPATFRFCGSCGAALERACPSCSAAMPAAARFCGACGADLDSSTAVDPPLAEERKVVTVVFADLTSSTELATSLDPEDLHRVYASYFEAMSGVIDRYGGVVEKFIGDAVVGIFGAPVTHEDDPERAVRAGVAMQAALVDVDRRLGADVGRRLGLRVGIHTGEVIASPGAIDQALVTGDTTSIAARLQGVAPPGGVVVSERTYRDTRRSFDFQALGAFELKGVPRPLDVWLVTAESTRPVVDSDEPFVGRADELALLELLLRRCEREGAPHLATIVGPAGIGKSRLAYEFAGASAATVVHGRCLAYGSGLRLWPLAEIVKTEAAILDSDPPDVIVAKAAAEIGWRFEGDGSGAALATLLSSIGIPMDPDPLAGIGLDAGQQLILNAWTRYFSTFGAHGPTVVWIEDIHWADAALLDLVERLVARVPASILFVCTARPELFERRPGWGARSGSTSIVDLRALSDQETARLVAQLLDGEVDTALTAAIAERTGGNPFFAMELVRALEEDGSIARRDGRWVATGNLASMPDTVQAAIAARIDRLEPAVKSVLQTASVVGRRFWTGTWDVLSGPDVEAAVETLTERALVRRRRSSSIANAEELTFEHALIREVAYGTIPKARRPAMHRAVLDWMVGGTRGREEEFAELLAYHAEAAGELERTARFAMLAGHRHRRAYAADEAIVWYGRAIAAADALAADEASGVRAEILHSRGEASELVGQHDEALADYRQALAIARDSGRAWLAAQELAAIATALRAVGRPDEAEAAIPAALEAAREIGWEYVEARTLCLAGQLAWDRGDPDRGREHLEQGLAISQEARDLEGEAFARMGLAEIGLCRGPLDRSIADAARARELWRRLGNRPAATSVAETLGFLRLLVGQADAAERLFDDAVTTSRELGIAHAEPQALAGLALVAMQRGELGRALSLLEEALAAAERAQLPRGIDTARTCRLIVSQVVGDIDQAARDLHALEERATMTPYADAVRHAGEAWVSVVEDQPGAREAFARARTAARRSLPAQIACGRIEVVAWYEAGEQEAAVDAAGWMVDAVPTSPHARALEAWALAAAGEADAGEALERAREAGDRTVLWRACALAGDHAGGGAAGLRTEARSLVEALASSLDEGPRERFLSMRDVGALLRDADIS